MVHITCTYAHVHAYVYRLRDGHQSAIDIADSHSATGTGTSGRVAIGTGRGVFFVSVPSLPHESALSFQPYIMTRSMMTQTRVSIDADAMADHSDSDVDGGIQIGNIYNVINICICMTLYMARAYVESSKVEKHLH